MIDHELVLPPLYGAISGHLHDGLTSSTDITLSTSTTGQTSPISPNLNSTSADSPASVDGTPCSYTPRPPTTPMVPLPCVPEIEPATENVPLFPALQEVNQHARFVAVQLNPEVDPERNSGGLTSMSGLLPPTDTLLAGDVPESVG